MQAGLTDHSKVIDQKDNIYKLRSGLGSDGAYGLGGTEQFGFKPMPGLENLSLKTGGKLGTLREATFEFTCYNMEQLNIMDALYMKLGFSILIEWGHIPYLNNDGALVKNPQPMDFYGMQDKEELMIDIQKRRVLHSGNYDAMWGTVKNFSYSFEGNGEFKCKVDLVGAGDILESLKINLSGNKDQSLIGDQKSTYPIISDANKSLLNEALYFYYETIKDNPTPFTQFTNNEDYKKYLTSYFFKLNIDFNDFILNNNDLINKGYHYSLLSKLNENNGGNKVDIPSILYPSTYFGGYKLDISLNSENDEKSEENIQAYITLGHLLLLTLATGGIFDEKEGKTNPYIYVDINPETNRCYTFPGHCSLDPTICLIGSEKLPFEIDSTYFKETLQPNSPFYDSNNPNLGGRFMYTLINIDFIVKTLRKYSISDSNGSVNFVDFIQDILTGISKACGAFNEFRIVPDDDTRCIRIFDDRNVPNFKYETSKYLTIPVLGKNSVAYNFNYTSKISPQMATQIVIAAQAQDRGVQGNKNSLAFSHLNGGLTNRLSPSRVDSVEDLNNDTSQESSISKYIELRDYIVDIYDGIPSVSVISEEDIKAIEESDNVVNRKDGLKEVPEDSIKDRVLLQLEKIYQDLLAAATGIKPEGQELTELVTAYNTVKAKIEAETDFGIASLYKEFKNENNIIVTSESTLSNYIHDQLEWEYKSVNTFLDTAIEAAWTKLATEQTGVDRPWY